MQEDTAARDFLRYAVSPAIWVGGAIFLVIFLSKLPFATLKQYADLSPIGTVIIAAIAASIAVGAMLVQRDTAKRRAAVDFFLKTETDETLINAYYNFTALVPQIPAILSRADLQRSDADCRTIETWLRVCELIAVGVIRGAFSENVTLAYWGDVLPETRRDAQLFIQHVRRTPGWGSAATYCDIDTLCRRWGH